MLPGIRVLNFCCRVYTVKKYNNSCQQSFVVYEVISNVDDADYRIGESYIRDTAGHAK